MDSDIHHIHAQRMQRQYGGKFLFRSSWAKSMSLASGTGQQNAVSYAITEAHYVPAHLFYLASAFLFGGCIGGGDGSGSHCG
jgi:hypothetical protein